MITTWGAHYYCVDCAARVLGGPDETIMEESEDEENFLPDGPRLPDGTPMPRGSFSIPRRRPPPPRQAMEDEEDEEEEEDEDGMFSSPRQEGEVIIEEE